MDSPALIVFCGLPGVGKSTASAYAAEQCGATRYRSDEVRKSLFDDPSYTDAEIRQTYEEMLSRAQGDLERGDSVVADATFNRRAYRKLAAETATAAGVDVVFVRVTCSPDTVRERIAAREGGVSDADFEVYRELRAEFEPFERDHAVVDNSGSIASTREQVDAVLCETVCDSGPVKQ